MKLYFIIHFCIKRITSNSQLIKQITNFLTSNFFFSFWPKHFVANHFYFHSKKLKRETPFNSLFKNPKSPIYYAVRTTCQTVPFIMLFVPLAKQSYLLCCSYHLPKSTIYYAVSTTCQTVPFIMLLVQLA